jgi:hypothetical protein
VGKRQDARERIEARIIELGRRQDRRRLDSSDG